MLLNETTWVNMTYSETINYNALIEVDAMSSVTVSGELKWAELDVMIFDGEIRYDEDLVLLCWFNEECPDDAYYARYKGAPRVTNAFGFNRTAVGGLRSPPLTRVVVGVRNHLARAITFSIRLLGCRGHRQQLRRQLVFLDRLYTDSSPTTTRDVTAARRTGRAASSTRWTWASTSCRCASRGRATSRSAEHRQGLFGALYVGEAPTMLTPPAATRTEGHHQHHRRRPGVRGVLLHRRREQAGGAVHDRHRRRRR